MFNTRARANEMIMSLSKTKEIVFRRPGPRHFMNPPPINNVEHVDLVNLLGILLLTIFVVMHKLVMYLKCD